jgi:DNA-binding NarL/FixJ family response regulator
VLSRLKTEGVDSKIIVLTMHCDASWRRGPCAREPPDFWSKSRPARNSWSPSTKFYRAGGLAPAVTGGVMARMAVQGQTEPQLTARQLDVLRHILLGKRMKEIAATLNLSTRRSKRTNIR